MTVNCTILSMQTVQHSFKELTNNEDIICLLNQGLMSDGYENSTNLPQQGWIRSV